MKAIGFLALVATALTACGDRPSPLAPTGRPDVGGISAAVVINERFDFDNLVNNPCNGELVLLTLDFHLVVRTTTGAGGGSHDGSHVNAHGEGVGLTTGAKYQFNEIHNFQASVSESFPDGSLSQTFTDYFLVIAQENVPNFVLKVLFHMTTNANGEVTSMKTEFSPACRG